MFPSSLTAAAVDAAAFLRVAPMRAARRTRALRECLHGVLVTPLAGGGVAAVATDMHVIAVCVDPDGRAPRPLVVEPERELLTVARIAVQRSRGRVALHLADDGRCAVDVGQPSRYAPPDVTFRCTPFDAGLFPRWREALPRPDSFAPAGAGHLVLNVGHLARIREALTLRRTAADARTAISLHPARARRGTEVTVVRATGTPGWIAVVMPADRAAEAVWDPRRADYAGLHAALVAAPSGAGADAAA